MRICGVSAWMSGKHTCTHARTHACTHTRMHTHTHTHTRCQITGQLGPFNLSGLLPVQNWLACPTVCKVSTAKKKSRQQESIKAWIWCSHHSSLAGALFFFFFYLVGYVSVPGVHCCQKWMKMWFQHLFCVMILNLCVWSHAPCNWRGHSPKYFVV